MRSGTFGQDDFIYTVSARYALHAHMQGGWSLAAGGVWGVQTEDREQGSPHLRGCVRVGCERGSRSIQQIPHSQDRASSARHHEAVSRPACL